MLDTVQEVAALEESIQALYVENQKLNKQQITLNTEVSSHCFMLHTRAEDERQESSWHPPLRVEERFGTERKEPLVGLHCMQQISGIEFKPNQRCSPPPSRGSALQQVPGKCVMTLFRNDLLLLGSRRISIANKGPKCPTCALQVCMFAFQEREIRAMLCSLLAHDFSK